MKIYTFEIAPKEVREFYDLRKVKKEALRVAKEINEDVLVTCTHTPSYKQDWYTALPSGEFVTDKKDFRADN